MPGRYGFECALRQARNGVSVTAAAAHLLPSSDPHSDRSFPMTSVCAAPAAYRIETDHGAHFACVRHQREIYTEHFRRGAAPTLHEVPIGERRCGEQGPAAAALVLA
jgi:hypothetical protein